MLFPEGTLLISGTVDGDPQKPCADVILVVHDGKIIESGTHRSLMNAKGAYYQLYTHQYREEQTRSMME